jgi:hypothetical protein
MRFVIAATLLIFAITLGILVYFSQPIGLTADGSYVLPPVQPTTPPITSEHVWKITNENMHQPMTYIITAIPTKE